MKKISINIQNEPLNGGSEWEFYSAKFLHD